MSEVIRVMVNHFFSIGIMALSSCPNRGVGMSHLWNFTTLFQIKKDHFREQIWSTILGWPMFKARIFFHTCVFCELTQLSKTSLTILFIIPNDYFVFASCQHSRSFTGIVLIGWKHLWCGKDDSWYFQWPYWENVPKVGHITLVVTGQFPFRITPLTQTKSPIMRLCATIINSPGFLSVIANDHLLIHGEYFNSLDTFINHVLVGHRNDEVCVTT